jgi:HPt (histidine-containing phosphotransfer) domain-containing protein
MLRRRRGKPPDRPVLDTAYLDRLAAHLGAQTVDELLADGLIELCDRLERMEGLAAAGERETFLALMHDLTAIAGHLGLAELSALAAQANREGRSDADAPLDALAAPLNTAAPAALTALRDHLRYGQGG